MAAPIGNTNAEKWTEETALEFINTVHDYNVKNTGNYHLGLSIIENGQYLEVWSYLANKFSDNDIVFKTIKKAEQFLESRIINSTISGEAKSAAMAIFYLKNKHGYVDKQETENIHTITDIDTWASKFRKPSSQKNKSE